MEYHLNDIIRHCQNDSREGQFELFKLFLPYVTSICKRYLKDKSMLEDAVQEVFLHAFKGIKSTFDINKGELKPWLRQITINCCLQFNKKYKGFEELNVDIQKINISDRDFQFIKDESLFQLLETIPAPYRDVFNLYIIDGYGHPEIAKALGISEANSRKKLQRARDFLKKRLTAKGTIHHLQK